MTCVDWGTVEVVLQAGGHILLGIAWGLPTALILDAVIKAARRRLNRSGRVSDAGL